jgi:hypothetical protein
MGGWAEGDGGAVGAEVNFGRRRWKKRVSVDPSVRAHPSQKAIARRMGHPQVFVVRKEVREENPRWRRKAAATKARSKP